MELNKIYNEDCIEGMARIPDGSVDLILADPPYNISKKNNFKSMGRSGIDFGEWDKEFNQVSWLELAVDKLSKDGSLIVFNGWRNLGLIDESLQSLGMETKDVIRWVKANPMPRNRDRRYIVDFEFALWAVKKNGKWVFNRLNETYDRPLLEYPIVSGKEKTAHPTQKPLALIGELIKRHTNKGDVVWDPFMGSGTTAVASLEQGRKFIGHELEEEYCKIAEERIKSFYKSEYR